MVYRTCGFVDSWRSRSESTATNGTDDGVSNGVYDGMKRRGIHEWLKNNKSSLDTMCVKVDHTNETTKIHSTVKGARKK